MPAISHIPDEGGYVTCYEKITVLAINPRPDGCKKLQGSFNPPLFRVLCGDYRVVYSINDGVLLVLIIDVGHRKETYKNFL